jgi:hypothetical protein
VSSKRFPSYALRLEDVWSGCIDLRILDLGTSWTWVVSFTPRPLYPQGESPCTHWIGGWVAPKQAWTLWRGEKSCPYRDPNSDAPPSSQSLYRLRYFCFSNRNEVDFMPILVYSPKTLTQFSVSIRLSIVDIFMISPSQDYVILANFMD